MALRRFFKKKEEHLSEESTPLYVDGIKKVPVREIHPEIEKVQEAETAPLVSSEGIVKEKEKEGNLLGESGEDTVSPSSSAPPVSKEVAQIEAILEDGLATPYESLPPRFQEEFRITGERTAEKISVLLKDARRKIKKILDLIRSWLKMLPGVGKLFIEQEARNKTEKILELRKK